MYFNKVSVRLFKSVRLNQLLNNIGLPRPVPLDNTTLVGGVPRSGTTWLAETLAGRIGAKMLDEPLHLGRYPELRREAQIDWRPSLVPHEDSPHLEEHIRNALAGQIPGLFTFSSPHLHHQLWSYLTGKDLVVKTVRSGQLLPWLSERFSGIRGLIYTFRHPCAVVASQLDYKHGAGWRNRSVSKLTFPLLQRLPAERTDAVQAIIDRVTKVEEVLALQWCVDNYSPLQHGIAPFKGTLTTYEALLLHPERELDRILQALGYGNEGRNTSLTKPSHSASGDLRDPQAQLSKWKDVLTVEQIDAILHVVDGFGINLYTEDPRPKVPLHAHLQRV